MKRFLLIPLALLLAISLVAIGCPSPSTEEPTSPTQPTAPTTPPPGDVIELTFANHMPTGTFQARYVIETWGSTLEAITGHKVKMVYFHGGVLGGAVDGYDIAAKGIADLSWSCIPYTPGRFPKTEVFMLPFTCAYTSRQNALAIWKMYPQYFADEYQDVQLIWMGSAQGVQLFTTKKQVKTIDDLKGMKLGVHPVAASALAALGASPVALPVTELYEALQKGTIDGCFTDWPMIKGLRLYEEVKYCTVMNFYGIPCPFVMNKNTYESLPEDVKTCVDRRSGLWAEQWACLETDLDSLICKDFAMQQGMVSYDLPDSEMEKAHSMVQPVIDKWVSDMEAKGLPGRELLDEAWKSLDYFQYVDREYELAVNAD